MGMTEGQFQGKLIKEIEVLLPGAIVLKNDANYIQGIPDLLVLYNDRWALLECKIAKPTRAEDFQPNQEYYVTLANKMSFARVVYPENKKEVLHELQQALRVTGSACLFRG